MREIPDSIADAANVALAIRATFDAVLRNSRSSRRIACAPLTTIGPDPSVVACIDRERASSPGSPGTTPPLQVLYTLVRSDLPHGAQVAQTAHAASEASGHPPTIVVALSVPDEPALRDLARALGEAGIGHALVVEDAGPLAGQATSLGIFPSTDRAAIRRMTGALPLVR